MLPPFRHRTAFSVVAMLALLSISTPGPFAALKTTPSQKQSGQDKYIIRPPVNAGAMLSVVARSTRQIQIQVTDQNDQPVPDLPVIFSLANTSVGTIAAAVTGQEQIQPPPGSANPLKLKSLTDAGGKASVRFTAGGAMGAVLFTAAIEGSGATWSGALIVDDNEKVPNEPVGSLTVSGQAYLNTNEARTGATVFCADAIRTGPNSQAIIALDALGRITLQSDVTIQVIACSSEKLIVRCDCPTTYIRVAEGNVEIVAPSNKPPTDEIIAAGREKKVQSPAFVVMSRGTRVTMRCQEKRYEAPIFWLGKGGVLTLLGIAAIIPVVVLASQSGERNRRPVSASQP